MILPCVCVCVFFLPSVRVYVCVCVCAATAAVKGDAGEGRWKMKVRTVMREELEQDSSAKLPPSKQQKHLESSLKDELEKVDRVYSAAGKDMTQFPTFSFKGNCSLGVCVYFVVLYFARTGLHSCVCVHCSRTFSNMFTFTGSTAVCVYIVVVHTVMCSPSLVSTVICVCIVVMHTVVCSPSLVSTVICVYFVVVVMHIMMCSPSLVSTVVCVYFVIVAVRTVTCLPSLVSTAQLFVCAVSL